MKLFNCRLCPEYSIWIRETDGSIRSENLTVRNFMLVYEPDSGYLSGDTQLTGRLSLVSVSNDNNNKVVYTAYGNPLTHESAAYWADKLKKYTAFQ
jgi:hypothetical protein